jgi:hypothetical protein
MKFSISKKTPETATTHAEITAVIASDEQELVRLKAAADTAEARFKSEFETAPIEDLKAMQTDLADARLAVAQIEARLPKLKERASAALIKERTAELAQHVAEHTALVPEYFETAQRLCELGQKLQAARERIEANSHGLPVLPHLPGFCLFLYDMGAVRGSRPQLRLVSELHTWAAGCTEAAARFQRAITSEPEPPNPQLQAEAAEERKRRRAGIMNPALSLELNAEREAKKAAKAAKPAVWSPNHPLWTASKSEAA